MIYGPPAVGKLTVAKEVARLTGMKLFDNHATVNAIAPIFGHAHDAYFRLLPRIRLAILEEALQADIDIVSTYVYNHARSQASSEYFRQIDRLFASHDAQLLFLRLTCDRAALDGRVTSEDRRLKGAINTVERLASYIDERDPDQPIPGRDSLTIDNTSLSPTEVAEAAIGHFGLPAAAAAL
jgi:shikimate kinase